MDRLTNKYRKMQINQLKELKDFNEARAARVGNMEWRNDMMKFQNQYNYQNEYNKIRQHLNSKVLPDETKKKLEGRQKTIDKIFNFL